MFGCSCNWLLRRTKKKTTNKQTLLSLKKRQQLLWDTGGTQFVATTANTTTTITTSNKNNNITFIIWVTNTSSPYATLAQIRGFRFAGPPVVAPAHSFIHLFVASPLIVVVLVTGVAACLLLLLLQDINKYVVNIKVHIFYGFRYFGGISIYPAPASVDR